jgi:small subunit ribosomal protein S21
LLKGSTVYVGADGDVTKALRKFKKKVETNGDLNALRDKEHYIKPTTRRKLKASAAKKRWKRFLQSKELPPKLY